MAFNVAFDLTYEFAVRAGAAEVFALLADVPESASHFPKVARLVDLGQDTYRWEMERIGPAKLSVQTIYAARYRMHAGNGTVVWTPVAGVGNASVGGSFALAARKKVTHIVFRSRGELTVPMPGLMRSVVAPLVAAENQKLIEQYVANLSRRFGGAA
jgi:carbon monoxide dehydrogenase subunit G